LKPSNEQEAHDGKGIELLSEGLSNQAFFSNCLCPCGSKNRLGGSSTSKLVVLDVGW